MAGVLAITFPATASAAPIIWTPPESVASGRALNAVACVNGGVCYAVGDGGKLISADNPTGVASQWTATDIDGANRLISVSCSDPVFCVTTDNHARVLTTLNPTGGASAWSATLVDPGRWITGVACPSEHLCVVVDRHGGVVTSTRPRGGADAWKRVQLVHGSLTSISCPSTRLCVATEANRSVVVSTHPSRGAKAWHQVTADPVRQQPFLSYVTAVSCAGSTLCVAVGFVNGTDIDAFVSTAPTTKHPWKLRDIDSLPHEAGLTATVSCGLPKLCVGLDNSSNGTHNVFASAPPFANWISDPFPGSQSVDLRLTGSSCARDGPAKVCVVVDAGGNVIVGT